MRVQVPLEAGQAGVRKVECHRVPRRARQERYLTLPQCTMDLGTENLHIGQNTLCCGHYLQPVGMQRWGSQMPLGHVPVTFDGLITMCSRCHSS